MNQLRTFPVQISTIRKLLVTVVVCSFLSVPLMLVFLEFFDSVFNRGTHLIDFSKFEIEAFTTNLKTAIFPFNRPEAILRRILVGAGVAIPYSLAFLILGKRSWLIPVMIGIFLMTLALSIFVFMEGAENLFDSTQVESFLIFLSFVLPAMILWLLLKFVWR